MCLVISRVFLNQLCWAIFGSQYNASPFNTPLSVDFFEALIYWLSQIVLASVRTYSYLIFLSMSASYWSHLAEPSLEWSNSVLRCTLSLHRIIFFFVRHTGDLLSQWSTWLTSWSRSFSSHVSYILCCAAIVVALYLTFIVERDATLDPKLNI
jgi:hypothetical protein